MDSAAEASISVVWVSRGRVENPESCCPHVDLASCVPGTKADGSCHLPVYRERATVHRKRLLYIWLKEVLRIRATIKLISHELREPAILGGRDECRLAVKPADRTYGRYALARTYSSWYVVPVLCIVTILSGFLNVAQHDVNKK